MALALVFSANCAKAQSTYTNQIIIVNGGDYGNPNDYVTVSSYNPETEITTEFATIYTQSVQSILIYENFAYVAAQDSIVMFNIDSYEKVAAVAASGVNQLATNGHVLVASFWYPVTENFVRIFSLDDLMLLSNIEGISGEAAGMLINNDLALVAIPGAWGSTTGKIAAIDIEEYMLYSEDDYGEFYAHIEYFGFFNDKITTFMKTPWGETSSKSAIFSIEGDIIEEFIHEDASLANKTGQIQNAFYAEINNGIGQFDLETGEIVNAAIVTPQLQTIAASVIDTNNNLIYLTTTDFYSNGEGFIYNLSGENTGSFEAGISAQAIAVDYRVNTGVDKRSITENLNVFPNPSSNYIKLDIPTKQKPINTVITDVSGRLVHNSIGNKQIDISSLNAGLYFVVVKTSTSIFTGKFIKK